MRKFRWLGILFFLMLMFLFQIPTTGQNKKFFVITGKIVPEIETSEKGAIMLTKSGSEPTKIEIPQNRRFKLELEYFNEYTLVFSLAGHFSKTIIVSTDIPQEVWKRDNDFPPFPMIVQLFKEIEGIDKSFTLKPSGRVFYGKQTDNFEKESIFNDIQIAEQIQTATNQSGQVKKEAQTITKQEALELAAKQKNFDQLIGEADVNFKKSDYRLALSKYQEAQKLFPEKAYANDRIAEIQDLLKAMELTEKMKAEIEQKYKDAIARANSFFDQKTYKEARPVYQEALKYKPDDVFASGRIKEIEQLIANAEKQKQFDDLILKADKNFKSKNFDQAISTYNQAKLLIPENEYPQNQINLINQEQQQIVLLAQQEKEFSLTIQAGDDFAKRKDFLQAINLYKKALEMKPDNKLATDKISETEKAIATIETDKKYQENILQADQALAGNDLQKAKMFYQEASKLKSSETYPKSKLAEIALAEANDMKFTDMVGKGDAAFEQKDYEVAKTNYTNASVIKPNAADVKAKIKNIDSVLQKIADDKKKEEERQLAFAAKEKAYTDAISQADKSFDKKDYTSAQSDYRKSLTYKPEETYPTNRIKEIDQIFEKEKQARLLDGNFKSVIAKADKAFGSESYDDARKLYTDALALKPNEAYPTGQISKIDGILAEKAKLQQIENDFVALVGKGDADFDQKEYEGAKTNYTSALVIKPNAADVKTKIKNIDDILQKLTDDKKKEEERQLALAAARLKEEAYQKSLREAMENSYSEAMTKADKAYNENDFKSAKTGYEAALVIKANDPKAREKLGLTEAKLSQLAKLTQAYNTAITKANELVTDKRYLQAKEKYEESLQYLPDSDYPKGQIEKLNGLLAQAAAEHQKEESYTSSMKEGETLFTNKDYPGARALFARASDLKPAEPLPVTRIKEIDKILSDLALQESKNKTIETNYQESIKRADKALADKEFTPARLIYAEALSIKPNEKYPKDKIAEIDKIMADLKAQQYSKAISAGDIAFKANQFEEATSQYELALTVKANDDYAKKQLAAIATRKTSLQEEQNRLKKLNEQYDALMADAGTDLKNIAYQKSKEKYQKASTLKPSETLPKEQIAKIDELLNEIRNAEETDRLYAESVKTALDAFRKNKLTEARDAYQKAHDYKPAEPIPPRRIDELDKMIAQLEEAAKLSAMEESKRLAKEKASKEEYEKAIAAADRAFAEKQYKNSRTEYTNALSVLPNENYPNDQIRKIDDLIASQEKSKMLAKEQTTKDSLMKVRDAAFNVAIASAKESEQAKQYQNAILKYKEAITINTNERGKVEKMIAGVEEQIRLLGIQVKQYKEKIALADRLRNDKKLGEALAEYQNASKIKPDEEYPKNQITEIQKIIAAEKGIYATAINNGDQAFDKSDWTNAKIAYNEALKIKPEESYPKNRLLEIDQKILAEKDAAMKEAATTVAFNEAMGKGEKAVKNDRLTEAKNQFNVALTLKPNESLPAQRIREIDALIEKKNQENVAKAQLEIDEKYRLSISLADNAFKTKNYPNAKSRYQEAQVIKPEESYPKEQIALIDKLMTEAKPAATFADKMPQVKTVAPTDKPQIVKQPVTKPIINPIETAQAIQARAESYKTVANYDEAIRKADDSFGIKDYSVARFFYYKANELRPTEEYPKNQIELIRKLVDAELSTIDRTGYEQAVSQADGAFKKENYNVARFFYNRALEIKSWEKYPKDRIQEIMALTNSMLSEKEEKAYKEMISKADEALVDKDIAIARFYYNKAIGIKKEEDYPRIKLKDIQKLVSQDEKDQQNLEYNKLIEQADQALKSENYSIARFNYNKALNMKPDEKYPKDQLKQIKEAFDKSQK